jgi:Ca-activated chloride channel family protein
MKLTLAALMLALLSGHGRAQIVLNPPRDPGVIHVDVDLVNVLCTVRDKTGHFVKGLTQADFEIRQDGKPRNITHFAHEVDTPISVALLLDVSGSVTPVLGQEKAAAARFFEEVLRPTDRGMLVGFAQLIAVWEDLTQSKTDLLTALASAGPGALPTGNPEFHSRGGTLLYDAVVLVASQKMKRLPGRKTMILITDGEDNGSLESSAKAVLAAQDADAVIYGVHYNESHYRGPTTDGLCALNKLCEPTGGRAFHVTDKMQLTRIFAEIAEELRNQYGLGYTPPPGGPAGTFHKLEVKSTKAGLKAQARTGYFSSGR